MSLQILTKASIPSNKEDENKFSAKPNNSESSEFNAEENARTIKLRSSLVKRELKIEEKSVDSCAAMDLEELLAQTYPKEVSTPIYNSHEVPAEGSVRRSKRAKTNLVVKTPERVADSSKRWSGDDEVCLSRFLLECTSPEGKVNIAAFYQRAKEALHFEVSTKQLYDKMRNMKTRFLSIKSKLKQQNISEENYVYKTPYEPALFAIWKRLWENNTIVPKIEAETPINLRDSNEIDGENRGDETGRGANGDDSSEGLQEEEDFQTLMQNAREHGGRRQPQGERRALGDNNMDGVTASDLKPSGGFNGRGKVGGSVIPIVLRRMKELADAVNTVEEYPYLDATEARELQQKWRRIRMQEVRLFSEGLGLLNEQCKLMLESLGASNGGHGA